MTRKLSAVLLGLNLLPMIAAERSVTAGPRQSFEVATTERLNFPPGGTVRIENSYGYLTVEGWEEPAVEVTVTKSIDRFQDPEWKTTAAQRFDRVRVAVERRSDKELAISTTLLHRTGFFPSIERAVLKNNRRGVILEIKVRAPRTARLIVHHDNGYVWVSDLTGDIEVNSHTGDMIVMLPDPGPQAIDARTAVGRIASDLSGKTSNPLLTGGRLLCPADAPASRIRLRMGRGSIEVKSGSSSLASK